ncbi:MAG TPA: MBL fold metallo-hydrolase [Gemmatimonadales bacterium]|nr:MBL fold metallo-hydrolase [Gemmatimonadales bacterium]
MPGRRDVLALAAGLLPAVWRPPRFPARRSRTRLILLGTAGGPRPKRDHAAPSQVIIANDVPYVVDCGNGVARQLVLAGVSLQHLRHVFLTHQHSDHNADYGNLLLLAWSSGLRTRVDTWGPPPIARMTRQFLELNRLDIETRIADEGRVPLAPLVHVHELASPGVVLQDENVKVTSAMVHHPPVTPAFAFRFDAPDRSIVVSGDTTPSDELVRLARGADVLVHEALYLPAVDRLVARVPNAATLRAHIVGSHTSAEDCGRVAAAAGVRTLVLSHLVPPDDPEVTERMWVDAARPHFSGEIIVGRDLMEI